MPITIPPLGSAYAKQLTHNRLRAMLTWECRHARSAYANAVNGCQATLWLPAHVHRHLPAMLTQNEKLLTHTAYAHCLRQRPKLLSCNCLIFAYVHRHPPSWQCLRKIAYAHTLRACLTHIAYARLLTRTANASAPRAIMPLPQAPLGCHDPRHVLL